jgi:hypothetical protein
LCLEKTEGFVISEAEIPYTTLFWPENNALSPKEGIFLVPIYYLLMI